MSDQNQPVIGQNTNNRRSENPNLHKYSLARKGVQDAVSVPLGLHPRHGRCSCLCRSAHRTARQGTAQDTLYSTEQM